MQRGKSQIPETAKYIFVSLRDTETVLPEINSTVYSEDPAYVRFSIQSAMGSAFWRYKDLKSGYVIKSKIRKNTWTEL